MSICFQFFIGFQIREIQKKEKKCFFHSRCVRFLLLIRGQMPGQKSFSWFFWNSCISKNFSDFSLSKFQLNAQNWTIKVWCEKPSVCIMQISINKSQFNFISFRDPKSYCLV